MPAHCRAVGVALLLVCFVASIVHAATPLRFCAADGFGLRMGCFALDLDVPSSVREFVTSIYGQFAPIFTAAMATNAPVNTAPVVATPYDMVRNDEKVVNLTNIRDVLDKDKGWAVTFGPNVLAEASRGNLRVGSRAASGSGSSSAPESLLHTFESSVRDFFTGAMVVIVGDYNKGKTWFFNRLAQLSLLNGTAVTTHGLSIKKVKEQGKTLFLVDTAGSGMPIEEFSTKSLVERRMVEELTRDIAFRLADFHILLINTMTSSDQLHLAKILERVSTNRGGGSSVVSGMSDSITTEKAFFLVHNLRDISLSEFPAYFRYRLRNAFPASICESETTQLGTVWLQKARSHFPKMAEPLCESEDRSFSMGEFFMSTRIPASTATSAEHGHRTTPPEVDIYNLFLVAENIGGAEETALAREFNDIQLQQARIILVNRLTPKTFVKKQQVMETVLESLLHHLPTFASRSGNSSESIEVTMETQASEGSAGSAAEFGQATHGSPSFRLYVPGAWSIREFSDVSTTLSPPLPSPEPDALFSIFTQGGTAISPHLLIVQVEAPDVSDVKQVYLQQSELDVKSYTVSFTKHLALQQSQGKSLWHVQRVSRKVGQVRFSFTLPPGMPIDERQNRMCLHAGVLSLLFVHTKATNSPTCEDLIPGAPSKGWW